MKLLSSLPLLFILNTIFKIVNNAGSAAIRSHNIYWLFRRCYAEIETIIWDLPLIAELLGSFNLGFIPKAQNPS
jgi:hypothetical protein